MKRNRLDRTPERNWNNGRKTRRSFSLFIWNYQIKKTHSDLENLISFSGIYWFIGLRHEITEMCFINWKQLKLNSNLNQISK